ncbi:hypothetical protein JB92DRAFT_323704 [Gautieria morchelliformis]|nr:hypothetical protein JB92DRAFT_323704 [Gautieria morchelliformis]
MQFSNLGLPLMQHPALGNSGQPHSHGVQPSPQLAFPGSPSYAPMPYLPRSGMFPNVLYQQQPSQYFSNVGGNPCLYSTINSSNIFPSPLPPPQATHHTGPGFSAADEQLLARVVSTEKMNLSLAEIFRLLDGTNNHTTSQWSAFYMHNSNRINGLNVDGEKDGDPSESHADLVHATAAAVKSSKPKSKLASATRHKGRALVSHSSDSHSATRGKGRVTKLAVLGRHGPRIRLGTVERATPPGYIVPMGGGYKYTDADKVFFKKTLRLALTKTPHILRNKTDLARELAEGAPHHSMLSWRSWMRDNDEEVMRLGHEVLREVLREAGENPANVSESNNEGPASRTRLGRAQLLAEADSESSLMSSDSESEIRAQDDFAGNSSHSGSRVYLPCEKRGLAKYIANITLREWNRMGAARWQEFQAMYPRHTEHAWRSWYRINKRG